jgi:peptide/nickel transport system substrate-binding protein
VRSCAIVLLLLAMIAEAVAEAVVGVAVDVDVDVDVVPAVRRGGTLNIVVAQTSVFVRNFNPYVDSARQTSRGWMYEPLIVFNAMKPGEYFPRLAKRFSQDAQLKTVTFEIRENLQWSDGKPLTVNDVIFTYELFKNFPAIDVLGITALVDSAEKISAQEVRFKLLSPGSNAVYKLAELMPLPKHIWSLVKSPLFYMNSTPVGSGPFTEVMDFSPFVYKQCRNPHYWEQGKPYIDCLRNLQFSDNDQTVASARRGTIDWMGVFIANPELEYTRYHHANHYWQPAYEPVNIHLNTTKAPFEDLVFRQAFSVALNRKEMVDIAAFGLPIASEFPIGIGSYYQSWIDPENLQDYKQWMAFNPERAKLLLDSAGYIDRNGDGFRDLDSGKTISIAMSVPAGWSDWINVLSTAVQNLRDVGLEARLSTQDEDAWYESIREGEDDAVIMWGEIGATPWHTYWSTFNPHGMEKGNVNLTQFHQLQSPKIVSLLEQFGITANLHEQQKIMNKVEVLVAQQLPVIHLFSNPGWYQYNDARFQGWVTEQQPMMRPFIQKDVPERLIHVLNLSLKPGAVAP